jgi:uncharacterized membrane protein YczE
MKYTKYIIDGDFIHPDDIIDKNNGYTIKYITTLISIVIAITGVGICVTALPIAFTFDSYNSLIIRSKNIYKKYVTF